MKSIFRSLGFCLVFAAILAISKEAHTTEHCLTRPEGPVPLERFNVPANVPGLEPDVVSPYEGRLQFFFPDKNELGHDAWSPTGDTTPVIGPYDPDTGHLYAWGYLDNGWIEITKQSGSWIFGKDGTISPRLFDAWKDGRGDSVESILRSPVLGVQFYSGTTAEHWLTKHKSYRVYKIEGSKMTRVPELEDRSLHYIGDDPNAKMAVFAPVTAFGTDWGRHFVWFDGKAIVEPSSDSEIPDSFCN